MSKMRNPFEHHHDHDHDHDHDDAEARELAAASFDPAQRSMEDALRVTFFLLKVTMAFIVVLYLLSGSFSVKQGQKAVKLRFGKVVGDESNRVLGPGAHFALPYPLEQVQFVDTTKRELKLSKSFWYEMAGDTVSQVNSVNEVAPMRALNPEKDGSLITGDANLVHARWSVIYEIVDPVRFLQNSPLPAPGQTPDAAAENIVRTVAEQGIIQAVGQIAADDFIKGSTNKEFAAKYAQAALDKADVGIRIVDITAERTRFPGSVQNSVNSVVSAEQQRAKQVDEAEKDSTDTLVNAAGSAYPLLIDLIEQYEIASAAKDAAKIAELDKKLDEALTSLKIADAQGNVTEIGGQVAQLITSSTSYRTTIAKSTATMAQAFAGEKGALQQYKASPRIFLNRAWQDAMQEIMTGDVETIWLKPGQRVLDLSRDPDVAKARSESAIRRKTEEEKAKAAQQKH